MILERPGKLDVLIRLAGRKSNERFYDYGFPKADVLTSVAALQRVLYAAGHFDGVSFWRRGCYGLDPEPNWSEHEAGRTMLPHTCL